MFVLSLVSLLAFASSGQVVPQTIGSAATITYAWQYAQASDPCATQLRVTYTWPSAPAGVKWHVLVRSTTDLSSVGYQDDGVGPLASKTAIVNVPLKDAGIGGAFHLFGTISLVHTPPQVLAQFSADSRPCRVASEQGIAPRLPPNLSGRVAAVPSKAWITMAWQFAQVSDQCAMQLKVAYSWVDAGPSQQWFVVVSDLGTNGEVNWQTSHTGPLSTATTTVTVPLDDPYNAGLWGFIRYNHPPDKDGYTGTEVAATQLTGARPCRTQMAPIHP